MGAAERPRPPGTSGERPQGEVGAAAPVLGA